MDTETIQQKIDAIENELNATDDFIEVDNLMDIDTSLDTLQELREVNKAIDLPIDDEQRQAKNKEIAIENKIRLKMGLAEKSYHILDKDLEALILLDSGKFDRTCNEFIMRFKDDIATAKELESRIHELINISDAEETRVCIPRNPDGQSTAKRMLIPCESGR